MSTDRRKMEHISLESPWRDASNGGIFMRLASLDGELFVKNCFWKFRIISLSIDPRRMKMPPFDASRHGDSDDMCSIFLWSVDMEYDQNFKLQKLICANLYSALQEVTGHYLHQCQYNK